MVERAHKPNSGVLSFSHNILEKTQFGGVELRSECYKIVLDLLSKGFLEEVAMSDEIPFGVIAYRFNLAFEPLVVANVSPFYANPDSIIIHAASDAKFWSSPITSILYNEWNLNHKHWEKNAGKKDLEIKGCNLPLRSIGDLCHSLLGLHYFKPLVELLGETLVEKGLYLGFCFGRELCVYSQYFGKILFNRLNFKQVYGQWWVSCELQFVLCQSQPKGILESLKAEFDKVSCEQKGEEGGDFPYQTS